MPEAAADTVALPAPQTKGRMTVEQALATRRSRRAYASTPLKLAEVSQLLWAAQGITGPEGRRTAPSAGALFPMELYLSASRVEGLAPGIYHYDPAEHTLGLIAAGDVRREMTAACADQDCVRFSACLLIFSAVPEACAARYGDRAPKFIHIEAGHAAQNVYLEATALGLGVCDIGAFSPDPVRRLVHLDDDEEPICLMTAGRPV